jgi:hypothetical protein
MKSTNSDLASCPRVWSFATDHLIGDLEDMKGFYCGGFPLKNKIQNQWSPSIFLSGFLEARSDCMEAPAALRLVCLFFRQIIQQGFTDVTVLSIALRKCNPSDIVFLLTEEPTFMKKSFKSNERHPLQ